MNALSAKRLISIIVCIAALTTMLGVSGCSQKDTLQEFYGTWSFANGQMKGNSSEASDKFGTEMLISIYQGGTCEIKSDGTAMMMVSGHEVPCTWEKVDDDTIRMSSSSDSKPITCEINEGKLVMGTKGSDGVISIMVWEKAR